MTYKTYFIFLFVFIVISYILVLLIRKTTLDKNYIQTTTNKKKINIYRIDDELRMHVPSIKVNPTMQEIIMKFKDNFDYSNYKDANLLLFETLNDVDQNLEYLSKDPIKLPTSLHYIASIHGIDLLASKSTFAYFMSRPMYGGNSTIIPETYILSLKEDMHRLIRNFNPHNVYLLKKNSQRQDGIIISRSLSRILKEKQDNKSFVVCQKCLNNPLLVNKHKINVRIYLLVKIHPKNNNQVIDWYIYQNGFVYYAPETFVPNSIDKNKIITSGYIDRKIYDENPMTLHELKIHLGQDKYTKMFRNIVNAIRSIKMEYSEFFLSSNQNIPGCKFSLFGCDIAPDENLNVKILEVNKGPDTSYKDERDKAVKFNLILDMFYIIGLLDNAKSDTIKIENLHKTNQFTKI